MTDSGKTVIRVSQAGRMANQIAQMMFVRTLQNLCQHPIEAEGYNLPEWNLSRPCSDNSPSTVSIGAHQTRAILVARMIDRFRPRMIDFNGVILRSGNFIGEYSDLFPLSNVDQFSTDQLVIHLRLGDVATPSHPDYGPLPISYYRHLVKMTGLDPVFIGEIDDSTYCQTLRREFPSAQFLGGQSAYDDFQMLRRAKHIAIAVSSYSWIASYLSKAESIHVPVAGMLDPRVRPEIDLLPANGRYIFHAVRSWASRYVDYIGSPQGFYKMSSREIAALNRKASLQTAARSLRIHAGMALRMLTS